MNWITDYAAKIMFGLFVFLVVVVATTAMPKLVIPLLTVLGVTAVLALLTRGRR
ncbi:MAG: hypothetical protein ABI254_12235 [Chthoniobacterales bacterium]